jgi:hypothetical protein
MTRILDREKIEAVLRRRFPGAAPGQVAAAANAIVGLSEEWEEVLDSVTARTGQLPLPCRDSCYLREAAAAGARLRIFRQLP